MPIQVDPVSDMSFQIDGSDSDMDPGFRVKMYKILNKILLFLLFNSFLSFYHLKLAKTRTDPGSGSGKLQRIRPNPDQYIRRLAHDFI